MSNKQELIEMIHELDDEQLDDFAKDMLDGMTFAHNAGPATKRKKMLAHLEGAEATGTTDESVDEPAEEQGKTEDETVEEPESGLDTTQEPKPEPQPEPVKPKQRMLKNTKNGRLFPYNERLAKAKHIVFAPEE